MKRSGKIFALALLLLLACLLASPPEAAAQRIAVFPFDIYSERDATLLRNAIYNSMTLELGKLRTIQIVPREQFAPLVSGKTGRRGAGALRRKADPGRLRDRGKPHPARRPREPRRQGRHRGNGRRDHRALRPGRGDRKHGGLRGTARPGHPRQGFRQTGHRPDRSDGQPPDREHRHLQRAQEREGQDLLRRGPLVRHPGHLPDGLLHGREGRCDRRRRREGDHLPSWRSVPSSTKSGSRETMPSRPTTSAGSSPSRSSRPTTPTASRPTRTRSRRSTTTRATTTPRSPSRPRKSGNGTSTSSSTSRKTTCST